VGTTTRTVSHRSTVAIDEGGDDALGDEYCIIVVAERFMNIVVAMVIAFWPFPSMSGGHFFRGLGCIAISNLFGFSTWIDIEKCCSFVCNCSRFLHLESLSGRRQRPFFLQAQRPQSVASVTLALASCSSKFSTTQPRQNRTLPRNKNQTKGTNENADRPTIVTVGRPKPHRSPPPSSVT
jgi:hypothetical protein